MGVKGPKSKIEEKQFCRVPHGELTAKKWLDSVEKQKRSDLKEQRDRQTYRHTDIHTDRVNDKQKSLANANVKCATAVHV